MGEVTEVLVLFLGCEKKGERGVSTELVPFAMEFLGKPGVISNFGSLVIRDVILFALFLDQETISFSQYIEVRKIHYFYLTVEC